MSVFVFEVVPFFKVYFLNRRLVFILSQIEQGVSIKKINIKCPINASETRDLEEHILSKVPTSKMLSG